VTEEAFARRVTMLGALSDPVRRALYRFVAEQPGAVSREQAADGVDVPRHKAKFHLDRLVDEGLLVTEFRRLTGRTGPGAGRPAKLYRRVRKEVSVSVPSRRYDLAGRVLADATERAMGGLPIDTALERAAEDAAEAAVGEAVGSDADAEVDALQRVAQVLAPLGYEPRVAEPDLDLVNCPFDRLAGDHPQVVCRMNRAFVDAVVERLGCRDVDTGTSTAADHCCVRVSRSADPAGDAP
jgi:predicted ArsR family transcriptional regulator